MNAFRVVYFVFVVYLTIRHMSLGKVIYFCYQAHMYMYITQTKAHLEKVNTIYLHVVILHPFDKAN